MKAPTYLVSPKFLTLFVGNVSRQINSKDVRYSKALDFIKNRKWQDLLDLVDQPAALAKYSEGLIRVYDNEVHYDGKPITGVAVQKILDFLREGLPIEPLVRFLNNLYTNTDVNVRERLYTFLENNNLAITERGSFLVFKLVKQDGTPIYSRGQLQNEKGEWFDALYEVGKTYYYDKKRIVKSANECSTEGIYVGNRNYWNDQFNENEEYTGEGRMLIAEVYPQDVENVPHADCTKIVVSKMKIVDEYKTLGKKVVGALYIDDKPVAKVNKVVFTVNEDKAKKKFVQPKRDASGRFVSKAKLNAPPVAPKRDSKGRFISKSKRKR